MTKKINLKGEKRCKDCHTIVFDTNNSGYCKECYQQRPEVKEKIKEYHQKYQQRPEVKERKKIYSKKYYQKNRENILKQQKVYRKKKMKNKMGDKMLFPSCSETIWRLNIEKSVKEQIIDKLDNVSEYDNDRELSDEFPNTCLMTMIKILSKAKENGKNINNTELEFVDTQGANPTFAKECFKIAKSYINGKITKEEAERLEKESAGINI